MSYVTQYRCWVPVPQALQHFVRMLSQLEQKKTRKPNGQMTAPPGEGMIFLKIQTLVRNIMPFPGGAVI